MWRQVTSVCVRCVAAVALLTAAVVLTGCGTGSARAAAPRATAPPLPSPTAEAFPVSSETEPLPAGTSVQYGRWKYTVDPVQWHQRDRVLAEAYAPPAVAHGYGWALLTFTAANGGQEPAAPWGFEVILHAAGWDVSHRAVQAGTIRMPDEFTIADVEPGGQLSGNLGFWVPDYAADDPNCRVQLVVGRGVPENAAAEGESVWFTCR